MEMNEEKETPAEACIRLRLPVVGPVDRVFYDSFEPGSIVVRRALTEKLIKSLAGFRVTPSGPNHVVVRPE